MANLPVGDGTSGEGSNEGSDRVHGEDLRNLVTNGTGFEVILVRGHAVYTAEKTTVVLLKMSRRQPSNFAMLTSWRTYTIGTGAQAII